MITKERKAELVQEFGKSKANTGKTEVQIAILTDEIENLKPHFEKNKKDFHSKRGFMAKINKRKTLLSYLKTNDFDRYQALITKLGLRK